MNKRSMYLFFLKFSRYPFLSGCTGRGRPNTLKFCVWDTRGIEEEFVMSKNNMKHMLLGNIPHNYTVKPYKHSIVWTCIIRKVAPKCFVLFCRIVSDLIIKFNALMHRKYMFDINVVLFLLQPIETFNQFITMCWCF